MHLIIPHYIRIRQWLSFRFSIYPINELMRIIVIWDIELRLHQHGYRQWTR